MGFLSVALSQTFPVSPIIAATPTYITKTPFIMGQLGYAMNGVELFGPTNMQGTDAYINELASLDDCLGHAGGALSLTHWHGVAQPAS